jgi:peptide/nickel transport system substrate-binding protein
MKGGRKMMKKCLVFFLFMALLCGALLNPAIAGKKDDNFRFAFAREVDTLNVIHLSQTEVMMLSRVLYDTLLYTDPKTGSVSGLLATSWNWIDENTVEFDLRKGVRFHNGEEFDADDVVATVGYVTDFNNKFRAQRSRFGWIKKAEKLDKYKVRLQSKRPFPIAEEILSGHLIMWPNEYTAKHGHIIHTTKPVGTGPYKLAETEPGKKVTLKANKDYYDGPKPKALIGTITARFIPEIQTRVAEILAGGIDFIQNVPEDQAKNLSLNPNIEVIHGATPRITWLSLDTMGRSGDTPLKQLKVRRAISHAINRESIVKNLVGGISKPIHSHCHPDQFLCIQDVTTYPYDPAKAKRLLAEAGYAGGFSIRLIAGDATLRAIGEAIQEDLRTIGVQVKFETYTMPTFIKTVRQGKSNMSLLGFGGGTYDVYLALPNFFLLGQKAAYVADKQVDDWLKKAGNTRDNKVRRGLYDKIFKRITDQAYTVPLYANSINYVFSKEVDFKPSRLLNMTFIGISWK